jgi:putative transposase
VPSGLRRYDEPGHIHFWTLSCFRRLGFFHHDDMKRVVIEALRMLKVKFSICLIGYVIMPEHVLDPLPISMLLNAFKQYVGYHGKAALRDYWQQHRAFWSQPLNCWARGDFGRQSLWTTRGYDFNIDREATLVEKLDYCHKNPVTREIVGHPEDWRWSSYRYYELHDATVLAMDWDGCWPVTW